MTQTYHVKISEIERMNVELSSKRQAILAKLKQELMYRRDVLKKEAQGAPDAIRGQYLAQADAFDSILKRYWNEDGSVPDIR